jgi:hypothetical protein
VLCRRMAHGWAHGSSNNVSDRRLAQPLSVIKRGSVCGLYWLPPEEDWCLRRGRPVRALSQNRPGNLGVMWCDGE